MELKSNGKETSNHRRFRYFLILVLLPLTFLFVAYFKEINSFLLNIHQVNWFIPKNIWTVTVKLLSYGLHIALNFSLLLAISNRLSYAKWFVYVSLFFLFIGIMLVALRDMAGVPLPISFIAFFVKMQKSLGLLVLFVAGHFFRLTLKDD